MTDKSYGVVVEEYKPGLGIWQLFKSTGSCLSALEEEMCADKLRIGDIVVAVAADEATTIRKIWPFIDNVWSDRKKVLVRTVVCYNSEITIDKGHWRDTTSGVKFVNLFSRDIGFVLAPTQWYNREFCDAEECNLLVYVDYQPRTLTNTISEDTNEFFWTIIEDRLSLPVTLPFKDVDPERFIEPEEIRNVPIVTIQRWGNGMLVWSYGLGDRMAIILYNNDCLEPGKWLIATVVRSSAQELSKHGCMYKVAKHEAAIPFSQPEVKVVNEKIMMVLTLHRMDIDPGNPESRVALWHENWALPVECDDVTAGWLHGESGQFRGIVEISLNTEDDFEGRRVIIKATGPAAAPRVCKDPTPPPSEGYVFENLDDLKKALHTDEKGAEPAERQPNQEWEWENNNNNDDSLWTKGTDVSGSSGLWSGSLPSPNETQREWNGFGVRRRVENDEEFKKAQAQRIKEKEARLAAKKQQNEMKWSDIPRKEMKKKSEGLNWKNFDSGAKMENDKVIEKGMYEKQEELKWKNVVSGSKMQNEKGFEKNNGNMYQDGLTWKKNFGTSAQMQNEKDIEKEKERKIEGQKWKNYGSDAKMKNEKKVEKELERRREEWKNWDSGAKMKNEKGFEKDNGKINEEGQKWKNFDSGTKMKNEKEKEWKPEWEKWKNFGSGAQLENEKELEKQKEKKYQGEEEKWTDNEGWSNVNTDENWNTEKKSGGWTSEKKGGASFPLEYKAKFHKPSKKGLWKNCTPADYGYNYQRTSSGGFIAVPQETPIIGASDARSVESVLEKEKERLVQSKEAASGSGGASAPPAAATSFSFSSSQHAPRTPVPAAAEPPTKPKKGAVNERGETVMPAPIRVFEDDDTEIKWEEEMKRKGWQFPKRWVQPEIPDGEDGWDQCVYKEWSKGVVNPKPPMPVDELLNKRTIVRDAMKIKSHQCLITRVRFDVNWQNADRIQLFILDGTPAYAVHSMDPWSGKVSYIKNMPEFTTVGNVVEVNIGRNYSGFYVHDEMWRLIHKVKMPMREIVFQPGRVKSLELIVNAKCLSPEAQDRHNDRHRYNEKGFVMLNDVVLHNIAYEGKDINAEEHEEYTFQVVVVPDEVLQGHAFWHATEVLWRVTMEKPPDFSKTPEELEMERLRAANKPRPRPRPEVEVEIKESVNSVLFVGPEKEHPGTVARETRLEELFSLYGKLMENDKLMLEMMKRTGFDYKKKFRSAIEVAQTAMPHKKSMRRELQVNADFLISIVENAYTESLFKELGEKRLWKSLVRTSDSIKAFRSTINNR